MSIHVKVVLASVIAMVVYLAVPSAVRGLIPETSSTALESFLAVVGGIYSVLSAFAIFVVWERFNALEKSTVREASVAAEVPRIAALLGDRASESRRRIATAARAYFDSAASEWTALARGHESKDAIDALNVLDVRVREAGDTLKEASLLYVRMVDALSLTRESRCERIALASHRMPQTLNHLLALLALLMLAAFLALPTDSPWIGLATFSALTGVLTMIQAVVWDLDHPFEGVWNVSKAPFEERAKEWPK